MRRYSKVTASLIGLAAAPASGQTAVVGGQTAAASQDQTAADSTESTGLQDIVVTAQRREENLQRTPVAVAAVSGDSLLRAGVSQAGRLQELVPALAIAPTSTGNLVFIRGVGNFTLTNNSDPATAFNFDEVYIGRPVSTEGVFYDLDRVEVLKGPQGTLYGRNATAGAINVIPTKPKLGEWGGYGSFSYGNYDALMAEGALNIPIGDRGAARISATTSTHDGYERDGSSDEDTRAVRLQMLAELTPDLTVRTSFDYANQGGRGQGQSYVDRIDRNPLSGTYTRTPSGVVGEGMLTPSAQQFRTSLPFASLGRNAAPLDTQARRRNDFYGAHVNIAWTTPVGRFTIIPAWRYSKNDNIVLPGFTAGIFAKTDQKSIEARFASERVSIFDITAGLLYFNENIDQRQAFSTQVSYSAGSARYQTISKAAYFRATAHLTDRLRATGGVRYTDDKKSVAEVATDLVTVCLAAVAGVPTCPAVPLRPYTGSLEQQPIVPPRGGVIPLGPSGAILARVDSAQNASVRTDRVTWRGAVDFDVSDASFAYASVETGYRSGGFNTAGSPAYEPEFITAYTLGLKNRFLDNRVRLNLEGFLWKYRNQQLSYVGFSSNGGPANLTDNIGRVTTKGIEAELSVLPLRNTLLSADVQYLDASYDSFVYRTPVAAGVPYTGCPSTLSGGAYVVNCTGFRAFNAPKWTVNLAAQQTFDIGDSRLVFGADTQHRSSRYIFFQYVPEQYVGSTWQTNAQVSFGPADGRWSLTGYVRNLENNRIPLFAPAPPFLPTVTVQLGAPRTYGARLAVTF